MINFWLKLFVYFVFSFVFQEACDSDVFANEGSERLKLKKEKSQLSVELLGYMDEFVFGWSESKQNYLFDVLAQTKKIDSTWDKLGSKLPPKYREEGSRVIGQFISKIKASKDKNLEIFGPIHNEFRMVLSQVLELKIAPTYTPSVKIGKQIYKNYCESCHGIAGEANGALSGQIPTPLSNLKSYSKQQYVSIASIVNLLSENRYSNLMSNYSNLLTSEELWSVSFYVKTLIDYDAKLPLDKKELTLEKLTLYSDFQLREMGLKNLHYQRNIRAFQVSTPRS